ncbi:MAG: type II toxin-antitoxin system RelE/ParE family toxin [Pseudomonadota bacterium]
MSKFRVSAKAQDDIRSIAIYTQETWGVEQRRKYLNGMNAAFERLADMPLMAPERQDIDPPVRIYRYQQHLVVYLLDETGILIVRVRHQSEDWLDDPL